ncbi:MAG: ribosome maturation factor RimP [Gemmatimonadaceae bacterium]
MSSELETIVKQQVDSLGYDLVDFRRGGTRTRPLLDIRIDRRDGERVSLDDCVLVSRSLEQHLDNVDLAGLDYMLEVSSPGLERPLRTVSDWRRYIGRRVHVAAFRRTDDGAVARESRELDLVDVEGDDANAVTVGRDTKGNLHRIRYSDVIEARLVFVWNRD